MVGGVAVGGESLSRAHRIVRGLLLATLFLVLGVGFLATTEAGGVFMMYLLERQARAPTADELRSAQAIALLGGRPRRVDTAGRLHQQTGLPLLVSGRGLGDPTYITESQRMAALLRKDYGAPVRWLDTESLDTEQNAAFSWCLLHPDGISRIALVTDPRHMQRAKLAFEHVGFEVIPAPALDGVIRTGPLKWSSFVPSDRGRAFASLALREWLGMVAFLVDPPSPTKCGSTGPSTSRVG